MPEIDPEIQTGAAREDQLAEAEARRVFYDFIAEFLTRVVPVPGEDYVRQIIDSFGWMTEEPLEEGEAADALRRARSLVKADPQAEQLALAKARTALVQGMAQDSRVKPPFEALYLTASDAVDHIATVAGEYRAAGYEMLPENRNRPDSLATECRFMATLCRAENAAIAECDVPALVASQAAQRRFLENHLGAWAPRFCEDAADATTSSVLKGVLLFARDFLADECAAACA